MYEQILGFATPLLAAVVAGLAFLVQWKRGLAKSAALAMTLTASVYFIVYPLMLSETGAEGARRSWSFTSAGLAVLAATGIQAGHPLEATIAALDGHLDGHRNSRDLDDRQPRSGYERGVSIPRSVRVRVRHAQRHQRDSFRGGVAA